MVTLPTTPTVQQQIQIRIYNLHCHQVVDVVHRIFCLNACIRVGKCGCFGNDVFDWIFDAVVFVLHVEKDFFFIFYEPQFIWNLGVQIAKVVKEFGWWCWCAVVKTAVGFMHLHLFQPHLVWNESTAHVFTFLYLFCDFRLGLQLGFHACFMFGTSFE